MIETKFYAENKTRHNLHLVSFGLTIPGGEKIEVNQTIANILENNENIIITRGRLVNKKLESEQDSKEFKEGSKLKKADDKKKDK